MRKTSLLTLLIVSVMITSAFHVQISNVGLFPNHTSLVRPTSVNTFAGYDSENITITLLSPANQSQIVGTINVTLNITSINGPLNLTLFIENEIYPSYNQTLVSPGVQNVTIDTTTLAEGDLNFTFYFENQSFSPPERETYHLVFLVNNHGAPHVSIVAPVSDGTFTGLDNLTLNITADYSQVYLNITVNGEITPEYNQTLVSVGLANYTINGSRYENGDNTVAVTVWTEEGLTSTASRVLYFLDYIRFTIAGYSQYSEVSGVINMTLKVFTPYDTFRMSVFAEGIDTPLVNNITISKSSPILPLDTTALSEGDHNITFIAYDGFGHSWTTYLVLVVNNHGPPTVAIVAPKDDIVVGIVTFSVKIESTWDTVTVNVYVDDEAVPSLTNLTVSPGLYNFSLDVSAYSKWQHTLKIEVETPEGLSAETSRDLGFASIRIEEIASGIVLLAVAFFIPIYRIKNRRPVGSMILVDVLFFAVVFAIFFALGVNSLSFAIWHFNLASIWAIGVSLIFMNWIYHLVLEAEEQSQ
ncbi:MAG: hypothetical protein ACTSYL_04590 [Candidatus Thorarchaeota archaeon]